MTNISQELLHVGFCNLVQVLWIICCFMWKRTRFLLLILPLISSFFFLSNFQILNKIIFLFSETQRHPRLKLGPHMDSRLMYHVYLNRAAGVYLFLYFFSFLSLKFQNIKFFVTLFCEAYKVETWYTHGQRVDLLCTPNTSSQNVLVPLFFFFFLSLQLAKIKNLHLQNCFNLPLMATAGGMWALLTLCYIFLFFSLNQKHVNLPETTSMYTCTCSYC